MTLSSLRTNEQPLRRQSGRSCLLGLPPPQPLLQTRFRARCFRLLSNLFFWFRVLGGPDSLTQIQDVAVEVGLSEEGEMRGLGDVLREWEGTER